MIDFFETITYGENRVKDYVYALSHNSGTFREFKDGLSLLKWYYVYQKLTGQEFTLKGESRMRFITEVFLDKAQVLSVTESILECDLSNDLKAKLIDFYYLSSSRVKNLFNYLNELSAQVDTKSEEILMVKNDVKSLLIKSPETRDTQVLKIGVVGELHIN